MLRYAVGAPSGHNTQPWRFHIGDGHLHVYADGDRALPVLVLLKHDTHQAGATLDAFTGESTATIVELP